MPQMLSNIKESVCLKQMVTIKWLMTFIKRRIVRKKLEFDFWMAQFLPDLLISQPNYRLSEFHFSKN